MEDKKPAADNAATEEERALEELMAADETSVNQDNGRDASDNAQGQGPADEEAEALEELMAGEPPLTQTEKDEQDVALEALLEAEEPGAAGSPANRSAEGDSAKDEEALALEELVAADSGAVQEEGPKQKDRAEESGDDGIITLKEVVALGGTSADGPVPVSDSPSKNMIDSAQGLDEQPAADMSESAGTVSAGDLSREEKDDLDKLIRGLKSKDSAAMSQAEIVELQKQVKAMGKRLVQLTNLVSRYDKKMRSYSEIMKLFFKKSEIMNKRIDAVADSAKGRKRA